MRTTSRKFLITVLIMSLLLILMTPMSAWAVDTTTQTGTDSTFDYLKTMIEMIKEKYGGTITDEELIEGALEGIFGTMDPYTTYLDREEADTFLSGIAGSYKGIGVSLEVFGEYVVVIEVFDDTPAERAGLLPGDKIATVDGVTVVRKTAQEVRNLIIGDGEGDVTVGILRNNATEPVSYTMTKEAISINPIRHENRNGIGYIYISSFNGNVNEYLLKVLNEFDALGIKKVVLDIRDNPGGEVLQAVMTCMKFVPAGPITTLDFKSAGYADVNYTSDLAIAKYKLVVLVNGQSASASEIVAGAIQDRKCGTLVGTRTFGKAKVQSLIPLLTPAAYAKYEAQLGVKFVDAYDLIYHGVTPFDNEIIGYAKITTGYYLTANGRMIDEIGLIPDITVADPQAVNDIMVNSIRRLSATYKPGLNGEGVDVYHAEKILKLAGYDVDNPDYALDAKTFAAIKKYQADSKLYPYGVLDFTTQRSLNDKLMQLIMKYDTQYIEAVEVLNN